MYLTSYSMFTLIYLYLESENKLWTTWKHWHNFVFYYVETSSCNLQFFSELITTQLRDFHMVSSQVVFTLLNLKHRRFIWAISGQDPSLNQSVHILFLHDDMSMHACLKRNQYGYKLITA